MSIRRARDARPRPDRDRSTVGFRKLFDCGTKKGSDPQYSVVALKEDRRLLDGAAGDEAHATPSFLDKREQGGSWGDGGCSSRRVTRCRNPAERASASTDQPEQ